VYSRLVHYYVVNSYISTILYTELSPCFPFYLNGLKYTLKTVKVKKTVCILFHNLIYTFINAAYAVTVEILNQKRRNNGNNLGSSTRVSLPSDRMHYI